MAVILDNMKKVRVINDYGYNVRLLDVGDLQTSRTEIPLFKLAPADTHYKDILHTDI